jgi:hypothetical protein
VADLANGSLEISSGEDIGTIKTRLLSPEGIMRRIALLDNVKSLRFSWAELEALITCPVISGKQMYIGEGQRPNNLTYLITLNGISLSTDLAQRCVIVKLRKPQFSGTWTETVRRFVADHRAKLIADAIGFLQQPAADLARYSRWGDWEQHILSRLPEPSDAQLVIRERQAVADVESEEADIVEEFFAKALTDLNFSPSNERVFIPVSIATDWYGKATGERLTVTRASRSMRQKIDEGQFRRLLECPHRNHGRGFEWWGSDSTGTVEMRYDIEHQIELNQQHRGFN